MTALEIARRMAELGQIEDAQKSYALALGQQELAPEEKLEAASFIFFSQGSPQLALTNLVQLYNKGHFQNEIMQIITEGYYLPNVAEIEKNYDRNCRQLAKYPYIFRKDFAEFDRLPIKFIPFDEKGFVPYYVQENRFGDYVNFNDTIITHYFFKDLSKPILARDITSQYELEYLNDNVRKSEWVAKENHIYLHYTSWLTFCAYLQCLNFNKLLDDKKFVFLIENEVEKYPIDFAKEYGIDYSECSVRPVEISEVNKLIWHTQLSSANGGDFFNEIFYGHPNLLLIDSLLLSDIENMIKAGRKNLKNPNFHGAALEALRKISHPTDKDILVAFYMLEPKFKRELDPAERIVPALFFQPHFHRMQFTVHKAAGDRGTVFDANCLQEISEAKFFNQFKYIKTFTPMRRPTTSYTSTIRFGIKQIREDEGKNIIFTDFVSDRLLNRSYLVDVFDKKYRDSRLVRFEDGKLNPTATFTALAKFLDVPYAETMKYCSGPDGINPLGYETNVRGFDLKSVYADYDEFGSEADRAMIEYFYRDAYRAYQYDFKYYKNEPVDDNWIEEKANADTHIDEFILKTAQSVFKNKLLTEENNTFSKEEIEQSCNTKAEESLAFIRDNRSHVAKTLNLNLPFINRQGQPLVLMQPLELDETLLEQPLYH